MKKTSLFTLAAIAGIAGIANSAEIGGLNPIYSKDATIYTGDNPDKLPTSSPTIFTDSGRQWTMAFTISDLSLTVGNNMAILFTYSSYESANEAGMGYQLDADGNLTLGVGGFDYTGSGGSNSPWKTASISNWTTNQPLTLFFNFDRGNISISYMVGDDESTYVSVFSGVSGEAAFEGHWIEDINFSAKDTGSSSYPWNVPNGVTGQYTLNNFEIYDRLLTDDQKREYATSAADAIPEPATAALGLLGLGSLMMRRRRS